MTPIETARGARQSRALGSSNLPVPTNYSLKSIFQLRIFVADPRSTPTCHPPQRMTPIKTARGARQSRAIRQFKSARPDQLLSQIHFSRWGYSWPTHEAPQPVIRSSPLHRDYSPDHAPLEIPFEIFWKPRGGSTHSISIKLNCALTAPKVEFF